MTTAASHQPPTNGAIAVMWAFVTRLIAMMRGPAYRKEVQRQLLSYEVRLILGVFRGDLRRDPGFMALARKTRLAKLRGYGRTIQALRSQRMHHHKACTIAGCGWRRYSPAMAAIGFERCVAVRRARRQAQARLLFVAPTRERLAGAPP